MLEVAIGWAYFCCWSVSFYPQVILNYKLKSTAGLSIDFVNLNCIGFLAYSVYNLMFYLNPTIRKEYIDRFGEDNKVMLNDVVFAVHALILCFITLIQTKMYPVPHAKSQRYKFIIIALVLIACALGILIRCGLLKNIDFLYFLSSIKIATSLSKYVPQAYYNYRRKSTAGWSVLNILLDFAGGVLSLLQAFLDSIEANSWYPIIGNPVKFALGLSSLLFDTVFLTQHYVLYTEPHEYEQVLTAQEEGN
jgi:cystinosin